MPVDHSWQRSRRPYVVLGIMQSNALPTVFLHPGQGYRASLISSHLQTGPSIYILELIAYAFGRLKTKSASALVGLTSVPSYFPSVDSLRFCGPWDPVRLSVIPPCVGIATNAAASFIIASETNDK